MQLLRMVMAMRSGGTFPVEEGLRHMLYSFADCVLDTECYVLHRAGRAVELPPKVFQVLLYLLEHRGRVVSKQEFAEQVWPEYVVSDAALESCVKRARQAVGDSGRSQRIIQTRQGHGYCFIAPVVPSVEPLPSPLDVAVPLLPGSPAERVGVASRHHLDTALPVGVPGLSTVATAPTDVVPGCLPRRVGEYKVATVLCGALAVSSTVGSRQTLDTLHGRLQVLYDVARNAVQRYGGRLLPLIGESILAVFGAPEAQEDHAHRAVLAAWDLSQSLRRDGDVSPTTDIDTLAVRLSLHTGMVAVGGIGDDHEAAAIMVGDTIPLTLAVQEQAAPGMMLCSESTARLVQDIVHLKAVRALRLPEPAAPLRVYQILRREPSHPLRRQCQTKARKPFVGRTQELAILQGRWEQVVAGQGQVVGIVGEPGIGKSRLVYEFRRHLGQRTHTYVQGRCLSYGQTTPYRLMADLLQYACGLSAAGAPETVSAGVSRLLRTIQRKADTEAAYLLDLLGVQSSTEGAGSLSSEEWQTRTFHLLCQIGISASQRRPLILEVEDLHWIDATSEAWLTAFVERLAGVPILLLVTARPGYCPPWMGKSYVTQLALARLTRCDSQRLVRALLSTREVSEALIQDIVLKADGNPFFVEELARVVGEQGACHGAWDIPDTIQTVLTARIDQLPLPAKRLLQAAAVIGPVVPFPLLQAVTALPQETLQHSLRHLQALEFLYETPQHPASVYTFKHCLIQEVAYRSLLSSTRQHSHRQVAGVLEESCPEITRTQPELVAHHYTEAGRYEPAMQYWQLAGQYAMERWAHVEAVAHLSKGLEVLTRLPDTLARGRHELAMQAMLGQAMRVIKGPAAPEVEHAYVRAHKLCRQVAETPQYFQVLRGLRGVYFSRPDFHKARQLGTHCLRLARRMQQPEALAEAHYALGITLFCLGDVRLAYTHLQQALLPDTEVELHCRAFTAYTLWLLGYPDQAQQWSHEALALAQEAGSPIKLASVLGITARLHLQCRDIPGVSSRAEALIQLATEQEFAYWLAQGMLLQGWALAAQGQVAGLVQMQQGLTACQATGADVSRPYYLACLAEAYSMRGQVADAHAVLTDALQVAQAQGQQLDQARLYWLQGALLAQDSPAQNAQSSVLKAEASLQQTLAIARQCQAQAWALRAAIALSRLWQSLNKRQEAHQLLREVYGGFTEGFGTADLLAAKACLDEFDV